MANPPIKVYSQTVQNQPQEFHTTNTDLRSASEVELNSQTSMANSPQHILVACYPAQGHINPTLRLAKRLARETGARITFSTSVNAHRLMFPNGEEEGLHDGLFAYIPYSNGYDDGYDFKGDSHDTMNHHMHSKQQGSLTLSTVVDDLAARGRRVTCIIYSFFMTWASDVARRRGIPSFLFWIQPATAFAVYWHYFHDYNGAINDKVGEPWSVVNLPELPPMRIRDLPSFIAENSPGNPYAVFLPLIRDMFETLDAEISTQGGAKPRVIANTADEMEAAAMESVADRVTVVGIGPLLEETTEGSLIKADDKNRYMDWLDGQAERSVVYVSFGSISVLKKEQVEEIWEGLERSGRPYLWVLRKNNRWEGLDFAEEGERKGMVVEWCSQGRVLGHRAVGCFVTHCGWNSTVESLLCGVPAVAVPQWSDQLTNAWLMEKAWGTAVRVEVREDGLLESKRLREYLEIVMGEGERPREIRRKAEIWKERSRQATSEGGSSHRNLKAFVDEIGRK